jgi:hypothetical protein
MKAGRNNTRVPFKLYKKLYSVLSLNFDLPVLIQKMKNEPKFQVDGLNSKILLNFHEKQVVLTIIHESTEIDSFLVSGSVSFLVLEGKLKFYTGKESVILEKGQLILIDKSSKYKFTSIEQTIFIITIVSSTIKHYAN